MTGHPMDAEVACNQQDDDHDADDRKEIHISSLLLRDVVHGLIKQLVLRTCGVGGRYHQRR
jgi:hypothetical protein